MSELENISKAANTRMVLAQIHYAAQPGDGQVPAFNDEVDKILAAHQTKFDNLARTGVDVTSAKAALDALANAVKANGPVVPNAA